MAWAWLILAGLVEVAWSQSIKPTENFTRPLPTLLCLALAAAAVYPLTLVIQQYRLAQTDAVICSPHLFLPDGTNHANPGIEVHYTADYGVGFPIATAEDPSVYHTLLKRAAQPGIVNPASSSPIDRPPFVIASVPRSPRRSPRSRSR